MLDRRMLLRVSATSAMAWLSGGLWGCGDSKGQQMQKISFELGKNIIDTASQSGVPSFQTRNVDGFVSYSVNNVPAQIPARYVRPGYEIEWAPLFAFTMYADKAEDPRLLVETVTLQAGDIGKTHEAVQTFVEQTLAQFNRGKWVRYTDANWHRLLTGRSSILDERGQLSEELVSIDPVYKIPSLEWPVLAKRGMIWRWTGEGVVAQLHVFNTSGEDDFSYDIDLEFESQKVYEARLAKDVADRLKDGDSRGMKLTAKYEADKKARAEQLKRLEANAIKRGDAVYVAPR